MRRFAPLLLLLAACSAGAPSARDVVAHLVSDALRGREHGSEGERAAAQYVDQQFRHLGLPSEVQPFGKGVNVVAVCPGALDEAVVVGAHIDHLGTDASGIYRGADDNASGVAALMRIASRFAARPARRALVFCGFGGEEAGILGSRHYVKTAKRPTVAMLNLDMVGRMVDRKLLCIGYDTSDVWERYLKESNRAGLDLRLVSGGVGPSDHTAFYEAGVPVVHFFTGAHADYHKPSDTPEKLNYEGIELVVDLVEAVARRVADAPERPKYNKVSTALDPSAGPSRPLIPYLGAMPNYEHMDRMVVQSVAPDSPAEKFGLKPGDVITALDGAAVKDLQDYSDRLRSCRPGQEIALTVRRGEATLEVKAVLAARGRK